jgi:hypothetical protein
MNKILSSCLALCAFASVLFGTYFFIDSRYALAKEVTMQSLRLDLEIGSSELRDMKLDLRLLEDVYRTTRSRETKEQIELLKDNIKEKQEELKGIKQEMRK